MTGSNRARQSVGDLHRARPRRARQCGWAAPGQARPRRARPGQEEPGSVVGLHQARPGQEGPGKVWPGQTGPSRVSGQVGPGRMWLGSPGQGAHCHLAFLRPFFVPVVADVPGTMTICPSWISCALTPGVSFNFCCASR